MIKVKIAQATILEFHGKIDTPLGIFVSARIVYYTTFKNEYTIANTTIEAKNNRVDLPVLVGYNVTW